MSIRYRSVDTGGTEENVEKIKNLLIYAGLDPETFDSVRTEWIGYNKRNLMIYSAIATCVFVIMAFVNIFSKKVEPSYNYYYALLAILTAIIFLCAKVVLDRTPGLTLPLFYLFMCVMYGFAMRITMLHDDVNTVVAVALLLVAPFLFIDRPIRQIILTLAVLIAMNVVSHISKKPDIAVIDMWNSIPIGVATMAIEIVQMRDKFQGFANKGRIIYLSETDVLTGTKNRNTYEDRILRESEKSVEGMVIVYADVNGLHEMNNTKGHAAGDEMLKTVASALIDSFGSDNTYRIGGDEFVVVLSSGSLEKTRREMDRITGKLEEKEYHISVGVAAGSKESSDLPGLVKTAEHEMYDRKEEYYRTNNISRRRVRTS